MFFRAMSKGASERSKGNIIFIKKDREIESPEQNENMSNRFIL